jgi:chromosome segregation ATPase
MSTLDRWLKAQAEPESTEPIPYQYKTTKPKVQTPTEVHEAPAELQEAIEKIQQDQAEIKAIKAEAKKIVDEAKAAAAAAEKEKGKFEKESEINDLVQVVGDGLDRLDQESDVVFRQFNGIMTTLQRIREQQVTVPGSEEQLQFVLDTLKEIDPKISGQVKNRLNGFKNKMSTTTDVIKNLVSFYNVPKKTKLAPPTARKAQMDEYNSLVSYISSGAHDLAAALLGIREIGSLLSGLESALGAI